MAKPTVAGNAYRWAHPAIEQMVRYRPTAALDFLQADAPTKHYVALAVRGWEAHQGRSEQVLRQLAGDIFSRPRPIVLANLWGTASFCTNAQKSRPRNWRSSPTSMSPFLPQHRFASWQRLVPSCSTTC